MKILSFAMIIIGTIGASVAAAHIPPLWVPFGLFIGLAALGMALKKMQEKKTSGEQRGEQDAVARFKDIIEDHILLMNQLMDKEELHSELLINSSVPHLYNRIEQVREELVNRLGTRDYIAIIAPFAQGERLLYRGYSAAIDGFDNEAKKSIKESLEFFTMTQNELKRVL